MSLPFNSPLTASSRASEDRKQLSPAFPLRRYLHSEYAWETSRLRQRSALKGASAGICRMISEAIRLNRVQKTVLRLQPQFTADLAHRLLQPANCVRACISSEFSKQSLSPTTFHSTETCFAQATALPVNHVLPRQEAGSACMALWEATASEWQPCVLPHA